MNRQELLTSMHKGHERLEMVLARVDEAWMTEPVLYSLWSVKDLVAHIGFWERHIADAYHTLRQGDVPAPSPDETSLHEINARVFAEQRGRPLADVRREEGEAYRALLALVETAPEDDLFDPHRFAWTGGRPLAELVQNNTYEHYDEHLEDLCG